jgi:hypothetical protein
MEKLFELEDELKVLQLEGVNTDKALDLLHEFINKLQVGKAIKNISDFLNEIENICKKYNLSISHEDSHGGFIIEDYDYSNIEWLKDAIDHTSKEE